MKSFWELREELEEADIAKFNEDTELQERISGSGTDRKAVLKKAFRAGQHATDRFYADRGREKSNTIKAPKGMRDKNAYNSKHKDKGIEKAFNRGKHDDDRINAPMGKEKSKSQDSLKIGRSKMFAKGKHVGPTDRLGLKHPNDRKKLPEDSDAVKAFLAKGGKIKKLAPGKAAGYHGKDDPGKGMHGMLDKPDTKKSFMGTRKKVKSMGEAKQTHMFDNEKDARAKAKNIGGKYVRGTGKSAGKHAAIKELSYDTMNKYHDAAQKSKDKATNSAVATIMRKGDHSQDLKTRSKRIKGMELAKTRSIKKIRGDK
jgi:hypothetical protein